MGGEIENRGETFGRYLISAGIEEANAIRCFKMS
jgi:hypothetical protein